MGNVKTKIFILAYSLILVHFSTMGQVPAPSKSRIRVDSSLIGKIHYGYFNTSKKITSIDKVILEDLLKSKGASCIAKPQEPFNETDYKDSSLCDIRLILFGFDRQNERYFIVYQIGLLGGTENNCIIYQKNGNLIEKYFEIGVGRDTYTMRKLKRVIQSNRYSVLSFSKDG